MLYICVYFSIIWKKCDIYKKMYNKIYLMSQLKSIKFLSYFTNMYLFIYNIKYIFYLFSNSFRIKYEKSRIWTYDRIKPNRFTIYHYNHSVIFPRNNVIWTHDFLFPKQTRYHCVIFRLLTFNFFRSTSIIWKSIFIY